MGLGPPCEATLIGMWCSSYSLESFGECANNTMSLGHFWLAKFKGVDKHNEGHHSSEASTWRLSPNSIKFSRASIVGSTLKLKDAE